MDLAAFDDWPVSDAVAVSDAEQLRADLYRRITTPRGGHEAIGQPEHVTIDVRDLIRTADGQGAEGQVRDVMEADERVLAASVAVVADGRDLSVLCDVQADSASVSFAVDA